VFWIAIGLFWLFLTLRLTGVLEISQSEMLSHAFFGDEMARNRDDLTFKWNNVTTAHTPLVLSLILAGGLLLALVGGQTGFVVVSMFSVASFIFFLPESSGIRSHKQMAPFASYALAYVLAGPYASLRARLPARKRRLAAFALGALIAALLPQLVLPFYDHYTIEPSSEGSYPSILADYDYLAVDWLVENTGREVRLVSDYYTMQVMSEMADKVTLVEPPIHPATLTDLGRAHLQLVKDRVFLASEATRARDAIYELADESLFSDKYLQRDYLAATGQSVADVSFVVVVTGRTSLWVEQESLHLVHSRAKIGIDVNPRHVQAFRDLRCFEPLYQVGERLYIFAVKPPFDGAEGTALDLVNQGNAQWASGDQEAAIRLYQSALEIDRREAEAYIALGEAYLARGDHARAGAMYGEAAALRPKDANLALREGRMYEHLGDLEAAIAAYERAADVAPGLYAPLVALGRAYAASGRPSAALEQLEAALRLYPKNANLHVDLGLAHAALGKETEAQAEYQKAVELGLNKPGFYYNQADSLAAALEEEFHAYETSAILIRAEPGTRAVLEAQPALFSTLYQGEGLELVQVMHERLLTPLAAGFGALSEQRWDQAVAHLYEAQEDDPGDLWAAVGLGRVYQARGQRTEALAEYRRAVAAASSEREARDLVAAVSGYLGMDAQYLEAFLASAERYTSLSDLDLGDSTRLVQSLLESECMETSASEQMHRTAFVIDREPRGVLYQHPPSEMRCAIALQEPALLRFSLALAPEVWQIGLGDGVRFDVAVDNGTGQRPLFSRYIDPKNVQAHRRWHDYELEIAPGASGIVTITLSTDPGPNGNLKYDWAGWGEPRLVQPVESGQSSELENVHAKR
jgi:tetratricopeptide (TPR) repeat protein